MTKTRQKIPNWTPTKLGLEVGDEVLIFPRDRRKKPRKYKVTTLSAEIRKRKKRR